MLLYCRDGQTHLFRYFPERKFADTAAEKYTTALWRQAIDRLLDVPQFITGTQSRFGGTIDLQAFDIGDIVERDHGIAPRLIDQDVAGDAEQIMFAAGYPRPIIGGISACEALRNDIVKIGVRGEHAPQPRPQRALMRKDAGLEP